MKTDHLTWTTILASIETPERLTGRERAHLDGCDACTQTRDQARDLLRGLAEARAVLHEPALEPALIEQTLARLREAWSQAGEAGVPAGAHDETGAPGDTVGWGERLRRGLEVVVANLVADSWQPQMGIRGADTASPRLLRFESDSYSITLSILGGGSASRFSIMGQVVPPGGARVGVGARAVATLGEKTASAQLSPHGEFILKELTSDLTEITIEIDDKQIRLPIPPRP